MKKHFLLLFFATSMLSLTTVSACPCEFSPNDARPFFEQYEKEVVPQPTNENENQNEKEEKS
jgi:hypothetical protein